jgi:curved DNA-binding protein
MDTPDPYRTLGLTAAATQAELKHAYRKLARRFHPDVSKEPDAEARFKELAAAYESVGTVEARAAHDTSVLQAAAEARFRAESAAAPQGEGFGFGFRPARHGGRGGRRAAREADEWAQLQALMERARGGGAQAAGADQTASLEVAIEDAYTGAQRTITLQSKHTRADGQTEQRTRTLEVGIPKGIRGGQQLRLAGQGEEAWGEGAAGDLLLRVDFAPHARYRVEGADVLFTLALAPWEAALGAEVACATPSGELLLKVPRACASGRRLRLKGRGLPASAGGLAAGDAFAEVQIALPPADTPEAETAYRALEAACKGFAPRAAAAA